MYWIDSVKTLYKQNIHWKRIGQPIEWMWQVGGVHDFANVMWETMQHSTKLSTCMWYRVGDGWHSKCI